MPFCNQCGHNNPDGSRFCSQCGTRLESAGATGASSGEDNPNESTATITFGAPTKDPEMTLITCYPTYYIGPAPKRLVVFSKLVDDAQQTAAR